MAEIVSMPKLGFDMAEGTLVHWVIAEGEPVTKGAILAEIETDKATVEVESPYDGVLARHITPEGEIVPVNTPIAVVVAQGEEVDMEQLLALIATSTEHADKIRKSTKPAFKRNKLQTLGSSPYVYLADPDVLLPDRPFFGSMISAFERNPQLGAVGLCYQDTDHVACGSMML